MDRIFFLYFQILDLYRLCGDPVREQETIQLHHNYSQHLLTDQYQASQLQEHRYINVSIP